MPAAAPRAFLQGHRPLAFAHRGGAKLWPENTLTAFRGAIDLGLRYIETDLHMTRDRVIVVHHDARLERTTDGRGLLREHTLAELERLDAGYRFSLDGRTFPFRGQGITIPTFEAALELDDEVRFNVEIKQAEPAMTRALWDLIRRRNLHDRLLVAAADDALLRDFQRYARGRVATSPGVRGVTLFWAATRFGAARLLSPHYDALQVPARHGRLTVVDRPFVRAAHAHGLHVHVWTIDDPREMRRLLALGVDGLMTDRPDLLAEVLGLSSAR